MVSSEKVTTTRKIPSLENGTCRFPTFLEHDRSSAGGNVAVLGLRMLANDNAYCPDEKEGIVDDFDEEVCCGWKAGRNVHAFWPTYT